MTSQLIQVLNTPRLLELLHKSDIQEAQVFSQHAKGDRSQQLMCRSLNCEAPIPEQQQFVNIVDDLLLSLKKVFYLLQDVFLFLV
jgi:hypothetical protein